MVAPDSSSLVDVNTLKEFIESINSTRPVRVIETEAGRPIVVTTFFKDNFNKISEIAKRNWQLIADLFPSIKNLSVQHSVCEVLSNLVEPKLATFFSQVIQETEDEDLQDCAAIGLARVGREDLLSTSWKCASERSSLRHKFHSGIVLTCLKNPQAIELFGQVLKEEKQYVVLINGMVSCSYNGAIYCFLIDGLMCDMFKSEKPPEPWFWIDWWSKHKSEYSELDITNIPEYQLKYIPHVPMQ